MAFGIGTEMASFLRHYRDLTRLYARSVERAATGQRINRAGDDPAGLAVSENLRAQMRGTAQAVRNAQEGLLLLQTADGAMSEITALLQRMRTLSVQGASGTLTDPERQALEKEFAHLRQEIERIALTTTYNTKPLLDERGAVRYETITTTTPASVEVSAAPGNQGTGQVAVSGTPLAAETYTVTITEGATFTPGRTVVEADPANSGYGLVEAGPNDAPTSEAAFTIEVLARRRYQITDENGHVVATGSIVKGAEVALPNGGTITFTSGLGQYRAGDKFYARTSPPALASRGRFLVVNSQGAPVAQGEITAEAVPLGNGLWLTFTADPSDPGAYRQGDSFTIAARPETVTQKVVLVEEDPNITLQIGPDPGQTLTVRKRNLKPAALGLDRLSLATQASAEEAIQRLDQALSTVLGERSAVGAQQNVLESRLQVLQETSREMEVAWGHVTGAELPGEVGRFAQTSLRIQASTYALAAWQAYRRQSWQLLRSLARPGSRLDLRL
ncbi:MAG: flagellin [Bacillota bacterium]|nr:flagellin [Bacillota bacterium]